MRRNFAKCKPIFTQYTKKYGQVLLTDNQYNTLIENYGEDLTKFMIHLLNDKITANRFNKRLVSATNHYQYFRRDGKILNFALEIMNNAEASGAIYY